MRPRLTPLPGESRLPALQLVDRNEQAPPNRTLAVLKTLQPADESPVL